MGLGLLFTPIPGKILRGLRSLKADPPVASPSDSETPPPVQDPLKAYENDIDVVVRDLIADIKAGEPVPRDLVSYKSIDTAKLWNGIKVNTEVELADGGVASVERENEDGYTIDFKVRLTVPEPASSLEQLQASNPHLPALLPALSFMMPEARVSPLYEKLYDIKTKRLQQFITRLNAVPDRHNFYDCDTILQLTHPDSGRKVFFVQADMDVVSDGSDGDRMPEYDEYIAKSSYYQPFTSYGWPKKTNQPNPLLERWKKKLADAERDLAAGKVSRSRLQSTKNNVATWKREIEDLKSRSFLIARADPFVVLPTWMRATASGDKFAPNVGDYAAVIYKDRIYPAIIGDTGPTWKIGEASLRLAKELNERSSPYSRPVSKLHVSYLMFPGTREDKKDAPDLQRWHARVTELLQDIGGLGEGVELHQWSEYFSP